MDNLKRRLLVILSAMALILVLGTGWYTLFEGWSVLDALYMTVITLTTVGFGEVRPLSSESRLFTIFLIIMGVGTVAYGLSSIGEYFLASGMVERIRRRRHMRAIKKLTNHIIICGAGRVGRTAGTALREMRRDFVIIDDDPDLVHELQETGWTALNGDATRDETLQEAAIARAAGLLVCTGNDSDNLFIVLSARSLNQDLLIVARSVDAASESKMRLAGADKVISPYQIGGRQMANVVVRPHVAEFVDHVTLDTGLELWLEEVLIAPDSAVAGQTVVEADMRRRTGAILVAMMRGEDQIMVTPDENIQLSPGDELIVLGTRSQLNSLEELVGNPVGHKEVLRRKSSA